MTNKRLDKLKETLEDIEIDNQIDHERKYYYNPEIVCPHCDYEYSDSWENYNVHDIDDREIDCQNCNEPFILSIDTTVEYSTYFKKCWLTQRPKK